jgi:peptidoglycan hydrolase-like protein with peptidoglycan-binding domain
MSPTSARTLLATCLALLLPSAAGAQAVSPDTVPESALHGPSFAYPDNQSQQPQPLAPPASAQPAPPLAAPPPASAPPGTYSLVPAFTAGLQRALAAHGYYRGPQNGLLDNATKRAILAYQRDAGLPQDASSGISLQQTLDHVSFAQPPLYARMAADEPPNETVRAVQERLAARGFDVGTADGILGPATTRAIAQFQASSNLPADGRITPGLLDLLK